MAVGYVGEIRILAYQKVPVNWLACDGQILPISGNEVLFSIIGAIYGGNGQTTFQIPDLRGRAPIHFGQGNGLTPRPLASSGGAEAVTLLSSQIPAHTHPLNALVGATAATDVNPNGKMLAQIAGTNTFYLGQSGSNDAAMSPDAVTSEGSNGAHNNMMTSFVLSYMICVQGIYPVRP